MNFSKRTCDAAHSLIVKLQEQFGFKDTMFPVDEQLFDNTIYQAFSEFEQAGQGLIEVQGCFVSLDQITAVQFDNKDHFKTPDNRDGLRCRILVTNGPGPLDFYGSKPTHG